MTSLCVGVIFMGYRILYFYKKENAFYRDRKGTNLSMEEKEPDESIKLFSCGLPEYYSVRAGWRRTRRSTSKERPILKERYVPWNSGQLLRLMQNCCETVCADAYYLEERFERELAEGGFGFTPGRQRMCGGLIKKLTGQLQGIDSIMYLQGESAERMGELPIPEKLLRKLRYFFYLGERAEQYAVLEENLWQEYGMPMLEIKKAEELEACRIGRLLVIDDRQEGSADRMMLPEGCVYLDLWSDAARRAQVEKNRTDVKYLSEYLYLLQNIVI